MNICETRIHLCVYIHIHTYTYTDMFPSLFVSLPLALALSFFSLSSKRVNTRRRGGFKLRVEILVTLGFCCQVSNLRTGILTEVLDTMIGPICNESPRTVLADLVQQELFCFRRSFVIVP